jgi:antirestriction protein ArdC
MSATKTKPKSKEKGTDKIYQMVTDKIIEALEKGVVPWQKPWKGAGMHTNLISKKSYRGINQFVLDMVAQMNDYTSPYWLTFKQIEAKGGSLKKINGEDEPGTGQKGTPVVFWKIMKIETDQKDDKGRPVIKTIPLIRYSNVFNIEQTDLEIPEVPKPEDFNPIENAQAIIKGMPNAPKIKHAGDRAFYRPATDGVTLPKPESFDSSEHYYQTAYHELVHSTGHTSRLNRPEVMNMGTFGDDPYAKEELVAEMGAAMLSAVAGIDMPVMDNSASYIASWLKRLKDDKKLVIQAASKAQQAADYIIDAPKEGDNA